MRKEVEFPRYLMLLGDNRDRFWMLIHEAGRTYDSGLVRVEIGGSVMDSEVTEREITDEERERIVQIADNHSASK